MPTMVEMNSHADDRRRAVERFDVAGGNDLDVLPGRADGTQRAATLFTTISSSRRVGKPSVAQQRTQSVR